jgi:ADP-heptose:LPS heptosyltransferase
VRDRLARLSPGGLRSPTSYAGQERSPSPSPSPSILVLKLGALGNMVLSLSAFAAIRRHHADAKITLLTTAPYGEWMAASPYFNSVLIDARPAAWNILAVLRLRQMLVGGNFDRVYDLQTSSRSSWYFRLFPASARPEWSGIAPGCDFPDRDRDRDRIHDIDRQHGQLRQSGITDFPPADLKWSHGDISRFALPHEIALLVPGSSAHRPIKRWPVAHYRALAIALERRGLIPIVVGTERDLGAAIASGTAAIDLTGKTSFGDLADLGRIAAFAVGNDTGPMHLVAVAGCASVVLFSRDSDPARCAPRGHDVRVLRRADLAELTPQEVLAALPVPAKAPV